MGGLCRPFPAMMEACKWLCLVATLYRILDDLHLVWFPACIVLVHELVIPVLLWLAAWHLVRLPTNEIGDLTYVCSTTRKSTLQPQIKLPSHCTRPWSISENKNDTTVQAPRCLSQSSAVPHKVENISQIHGNWESSQAFLPTENDEEEEQHQHKRLNNTKNK